MSRIVVADGVLCTGTEILHPATVIIEGERIAEVVSTARKKEGDIRLAASGRLVTPGLVNAHTHIYSALARGISLKDPPPTNFIENLERLWWRLDRALTLEDIELSARLHGLESLRHGVTMLIDHHASQGTIRGSLDTISRALGDLGLRACLCFEVSDRGGPEAVRLGIEENLAFINEAAARGGTMRRARFGLHASFTLSDATLEASVKAAESDSVGFHIHVAEDRIDCHPSGIVERLSSAGVLTKNTICVHGVHLRDSEIETLAASGAWLVHCPESNMNNAVGAASLKRYQDAGVRLALGTDGFTADLLREALMAFLLQNHLAGDPGAGYASVPDLPFKANAALACETFGLQLGRLCPGDPADLVVWDYVPPTPIAVTNIWGHILFGLVGARAEEVIVAGKQVLHAGQAIGCDEIDLAERCTKAARRLWERF